jgi:hypothetical protein
VVCFDSILPKYTSALLFSGINPSSERHRELFVDAEVYRLPWSEGTIATVSGWIICIRKSNKILIKILLTVSCVVVFLNAKIYVFALYKMAFHFFIFNLERHQREDSAWDSCNGSFRPWKSLNLSIQQEVLCDALMMD